MVRLWLLLAFLGLAACGGPAAPPPAEGGAALAERASVKAEIRPGFIELRRWREPRQRVVIDRGGIAIGPAGGRPLVRKLFVEPARLEDLLFFLRTYAPFRLRSAADELTFGGQGPVRPGAVEQRMIFEWARKVAAEVEAGQSQDSYGLVLAWQRGGVPGSCDGLAVYLDGEARASSCVWPDESRGRVRPEVLARLDRWYDEWRPFQRPLGAEVGGGRVPVRLTFAGRGTQDASAQEIEALQALAAALHRELALRGGMAAPPQPAPPGTPEKPGKPKSEDAPAPEPGPSLLLPPTPPAVLPAPRAVLPAYVPPPAREETKPPMRPSPPAPPPQVGEG